MSEASKRGKGLELEIARLIRRKLRANVHRDTRSGAGSTTKTDIKDWFNITRLAIEAKDQATLKIKEWFRQADAAASMNQIPTVVFRDDEEILATLRFNDLLDLLAEIKQLEAQVEDFRQPAMAMAMAHVAGPVSKKSAEAIGEVVRAAANRLREQGAKTCREGHIADEQGYCLDKKCKYRRGYRPPRSKA